MPPTNYQNYINQNPNPIPQPQGNQPNGLEKLLPTIGGIAGGIIGDVLPGGPLTGIAGASAGDALGKTAENYFTHQNLGNGDLGAAIEGGVGQGVGGLLAKGGQVLLGGAGDAVGNIAAKQEANASDDALKQGLKGLTQNDKIAGGVGSGKTLIQSMGVTPTADNMASIPQAVGDAFNTHIDNVLKTTGPVDLSKVGLQVAKLDPATQAILTPNLSDATTAFSATADAGDARKLLGAVQSAEANAKPVVQTVGQKIDPVAQQQYQNLGQVTKSLKAAIYNRPGVDEAFAAAKGSATPKQMMAISPTLTPEEAIAASKYANDTMDAAKTGQDVLTPYSKSISLGQAGAKAVKFNNEVVPIDGLSSTAQEPLIGATGQAAASLHPVADATVKVANKIADKLPLQAISKTLGKAAASKILPAVARSGAIAATNLPNDVGTPQAAPGAIPSPSAQSNIGGAMPPTAQDPTQQYYQMLMAQLQAQPADAQTGGIMSALNGVVPQVQQQVGTGAAVQNAENAFGAAGGAQGPLAGALSQASSVIPGSAAATYRNAQEAAAAAIAAQYHITSQAAMAMLPQLMQTGASAASPQASLASILGSLGGGQQSPIPAQ